MSDIADKAEDARDSYEWYVEYVEAGFTPEQAMAILTRPVVTFTVSSALPPEAYEFWERQNSLATRMLTDLEDD